MFGMLFLIYSLGIYANVNLIVFLTTATALRFRQRRGEVQYFFFATFNLFFHLYSS